MRIWGGLSVRPWSREVSRLLTGIKQTPWNEGVSGAGAGGRVWPGALSGRSPAEGKVRPEDPSHF